MAVEVGHIDSPPSQAPGLQHRLQLLRKSLHVLWTDHGIMRPVNLMIIWSLPNEVPPFAQRALHPLLFRLRNGR